MRAAFLLSVLLPLAAVRVEPDSPSAPPPVADPVRHRVLAADASKGRIAIFDAAGKVVWEAPTRAIHDLQYLPNGNVLFQQTWTRLVEMTPAKEIVWSYDAASQNGNAGKRIEVHAFQRLANGRTMIAESGSSRILEVDAAGAIQVNIPLQVDKPHPHRDTRLVRKLQNGNYLVAHEGDGAVREYDGTGKVVWSFDVPLFDRPRRGGHGPDAWGNQVFAAIRLGNGNTLISTGNGHAVIEVTPEKEIVWHLRQDDLPGIRLAWVTTLEILPNGHILIGNCHAGPRNPQIIEIDWNKRVHWTFKNFDQLGNSLSNSTLVDVAEDLTFYRRKVEPILRKNCYKCHGNRKAKVRGQLWLPARQNLMAGGASGPVIDPVDPQKSPLLRYINHEDSEHEMPPKKKLPAAEIQILTEWVRRGVPMPVVENEWIYEKPKLITEEAKAHWAFQPIASPAVPAGPGWQQNEIDGFVGARLRAAGLTPNGPADRISLIRRATYGLIGLPPTPAEIEAFVEDGADDAYDRLIDRLLASKQYGEHWGRHWLDLVRYAETNGYERDSKKPQVWKYRQYVIDAFNANKPYDRFVREQLAGDELPDADAAAITATGYLRLGLWDDEPADPKQARMDGLDDIVRTTGEVFLGLTIGCARCHDHKLDPIPQADYYSMLSFFHNVRPYSRNRQHILRDVATAEQTAARLAENKRRTAERLARTRERDALRDEFTARLAAEGEQTEASGMREVTYEFFRSRWDKLPDFDMLKPEAKGKIARNVFDIGLATRNDSFGFVFRGQLEVPRDGDYTFILDSDDGARLRIDGIEQILYDGIHGVGQPRRATVRLTAGAHPIRLDYFQRDHGLGLRLHWSGPGMKRRRLSADANPQRAFAQQFRKHGQRILGKEKVEQLRTLDRRIAELREEPSRHMVLAVTEHGPKPPKTHVMIRGSAHAPAAEVQPAFPQILTEARPTITATKHSTGRRLAFANWLVRRDNQLTARVFVNRVWQFHFGRGLVRTSSDFGMTGSRPTHPKLLDWLAQWFIDANWDIKALHRLILRSATYQRASTPNPSAQAEDPTNDLLWRFDIRRLTAEELRDSILAMAGQLDLSRFGGPSVFPQLPAEVLATQSSNKWQINAPPEHNRRRSVYTFVMRSLIDPLIETFDGATTDTSCAERFQTTQPTQALTMLNSGFVNRAAHQLAVRLVQEVGPDPRKQVVRALTLVTGREPSEADVRRGLAFLRTFPKAQDANQALEQFCLIALNLNAFVFVD